MDHTYLTVSVRELVALLSLSSWCLVIDVWLFPAVSRVCLQFVIMVFPDHTQLLSFMESTTGLKRVNMRQRRNIFKIMKVLRYNFGSMYKLKKILYNYAIIHI